MRTVLLAFAALAACVQDPEADPAATAAAPDTAEWFLSEYGIRIPPKDTAEFLECSGGGMRLFTRSFGIEYLVERCLPLSAVPPEGLTFCRDPKHQAPASRPRPRNGGSWPYYCPDAPEGTLVRVVTAADLDWIRSTLSGSTIVLRSGDPDLSTLRALRSRSGAAGEAAR